MLSKGELCNYLTKNPQSYVLFFSNKMQADELLCNMNEINKIINSKKVKIIKFLFCFKKNIEKILYEEEEIILINLDSLKDISDYFYLSLLIRNNINIINYEYDINLIKKLYEKAKLNRLNKIQKLKQLLISKILIELINNYKNTEKYNESEETELKTILSENINFIENNLNIINKLKLNYGVDEIKNLKIDTIYLDIIIILLIKNNNLFNDYNGVENLFIELDLHNINITKNMYDKLNKALNEEEFKLKYKINIENDLDESKIYFFYLLFKFILKDTIFIYQINFLYEIRINIIRMIKNNKIFYKDEKDDKFQYIMKFILDSNYYYSKLKVQKKNINDNTRENKHKKSEIKNDEETKNNTNIPSIIKEEDKIKNQATLENIEVPNRFNERNMMKFLLKLFNKSSFLVKSDKNKKIKIYILDDKIKENVKKIKKKKRDKNNLNILINNFKKLLEFLHNIKLKIENEYTNNFNLIIILNFFQEEDENNNSNSTFNIKCRYDFYPINEERLSSFQDENILKYGLDGVHQGFGYLINEINSFNYQGIEFNETLEIWELIKQKDEYEKKIRSRKEEEDEEKKNSLLNIIKSSQVSPYKIIVFEKLMATHEGSAEFIIKLSNGYSISGGNSRKLFIFDQKLKKIEISLSSNPIGAYEIKYHENKNALKIISFSYEKIYIITFDIQKYHVSIQTFEISANNIIQTNRNIYIINNIKGGYITQDSFEKNNLKKIMRYSYKQAIKINDTIIAFTSNQIMTNGKDRIIFYDFKSNDIIYELEGYSFCLSKNSLLLMNNSKTFDDKILICACKKYSSYQKNGILLIYITYGSKDFDESFYDADFEPFCLSHISLINESNENKQLDKIKDTNYFFVGGFDPVKGKGVIKLYKIILNYDSSKIKIEFCIDVIFGDEDKKFYGFNGAITSIVQSHDTGKFLISCSDGNIYLFSPANINYFLFYDQEDKEDLEYEEIPFYDEDIQKEIDKEKEEKEQKIDNKDFFINLVLDSKKKNIINFKIDFLI